MKIEDLTLKKIKKICKKYHKRNIAPIICEKESHCPLAKSCVILFGYSPDKWGTEDIEREVPLNENK